LNQFLLKYTVKKFIFFFIQSLHNNIFVCDYLNTLNQSNIFHVILKNCFLIFLPKEIIIHIFPLDKNFFFINQSTKNLIENLMNDLFILKQNHNNNHGKNCSLTLLSQFLPN